MLWKTKSSVNRQMERLERRLEELDDEGVRVKKDLADVLHSVRTLDLDMAGLEDKVKAFSGRISVRKRKDRQEPEEEVPELDLNQAIRDGVVTDWP